MIVFILLLFLIGTIALWKGIALVNSRFANTTTLKSDKKQDLQEKMDLLYGTSLLVFGGMMVLFAAAFSIPIFMYY